MRRPLFPFPALVGLDDVKLALQLAAIDFRLSVLIRGDKGAGKSTAARGLADLLPDGAQARFVTLPVGATEDRLLGGLDLERALNGEPALKPGLLADAHGGVLYIDEVNLLPGHLADALLDAVASGVHVVEREGFSATQAAEFVLIGSMNPEEGALRPQLLDRFALAVDVEAPLDAGTRSDVLDRRLAYDADPQQFTDTWADECARARDAIAAARSRVAQIAPSRALLRYIAERVAQHGVRSLRADLAVVRASRACAALEGAAEMMAGHIERVLGLALAHRTHAAPQPPQPPKPRNPPPNHSEPPPDDRSPDGSGTGDIDRVFAPAAIPAPRLIVEHDGRADGSSSPSSGSGLARGPVIGSRRTADPRELDTRASVVHAVLHGGTPRPGAGDLHERTRAPRAGTRYIFIVDASGSHAVQERMRLVKGAVAGLLDTTQRRHDEIVLIVCRGASASVLVEPTASRADVDRALEYLPTGGRTPLAHALELASAYVTDRAVAVLITDGHANVPRQSGDAWADALSAARALACLAVVIDSEDAQRATGRPKTLADAMRATYTRLTDLNDAAVLRVLREVS